MNIYSVLDDSENEDESPKVTVTTVKKPKEETTVSKKDSLKKEPSSKPADKAVEVATEEVKPKSKGILAT